MASPADYLSDRAVARIYDQKLSLHFGEIIRPQLRHVARRFARHLFDGQAIGDFRAGGSIEICGRILRCVEGLSGEIEAVARQDTDCERLMSVPGIGPIISSAMMAAIGRGEVFSKGRDFGAWLGLVPK